MNSIYFIWKAQDLGDDDHSTTIFSVDPAYFYTLESPDESK